MQALTIKDRRRPSATWPIIVFVIGAMTLSPSATGAAEPQHQIIRDEVSFELENPCTGEIFPVTMRVVVTDTSVSSPGGVAHGSTVTSAQMQGETASGVRYVGTLISVRESTIPDEPPPPYQVDVILNPTFHLIRQGEREAEDDFIEHVVLISHLDVESQTYTLEVEHVRSECQ